MAEERLDALITLGMRNCAYLAGAISEGPWLNEPQGLAPWMTCLIPPDQSFTFGASLRNTELPMQGLSPDHTRAARLNALAEQVRQRGLAQARIGLDMDYASASDLRRLMELLPEADVVSADLVIAQARACKTPQEIQWLRRAIAASEAGYKEMLREVRVGITFQDLVTVWAKAVLDNGALPIDSSPVSWMLPHGGTSLRDQPNAAVIRGPGVVEAGLVYRVDLAAISGGYFSDQKFNFCVGPPRKESLAVWQAHRDRQRFMEYYVRPGKTKRDVFEACQREFKDIDAYAWWIHGVGMDKHEEPLIGSLLPAAVDVRPEITFAENNVVSLESSWLEEDMYVLKKDRFERLGTIPQEVAIV
jgi:Xaa-Pro aminopeptidase